MAHNNSKTFTETVSESFDTVLKRVEELFVLKPTTTPDAIVQDHNALRNFLSVLKDSHRDLAERKRAYKLFSALLKSHSVAEEKALYDSVDKLPVKDLKNEIAEGYVEHEVCDDLMARLDRLTDPREWGAHANVLAELVEHHLDEEEKELLPLVRKHAPKELDEEMLFSYLNLRESTQVTVNKDNAGVLTALQ